MDYLREYAKRKEREAIILGWIPRGIGFWFWFGITIYLWRVKLVNIDLAASIGLGVGIFVWLLSHILLKIVGYRIIHTNLWENCGCGCLMQTLAFELLQYFAILLVSGWFYLSGGLTLPVTILCIIIGSANWLVLSYLNV